jgi:hypothetical protein
VGRVFKVHGQDDDCSSGMTGRREGRLKRMSEVSMSDGELVSRSETIDRARLPSTRSTLVGFGRVQNGCDRCDGRRGSQVGVRRQLLDRRYKRGS